MNTDERTTNILKIVGMGMLVFSMFALMVRPAPVMIDPDAFSEEALLKVSQLQQQAGYYKVTMYMGHAMSILGGLVMMGIGFHLTKKPISPSVS